MLFRAGPSATERCMSSRHLTEQNARGDRLMRFNLSSFCLTGGVLREQTDASSCPGRASSSAGDLLVGNLMGAHQNWAASPSCSGLCRTPLHVGGLLSSSPGCAACASDCNAKALATAMATASAPWCAALRYHAGRAISQPLRLACHFGEPAAELYSIGRRAVRYVLAGRTSHAAPMGRDRLLPAWDHGLFFPSLPLN